MDQHTYLVNDTSAESAGWYPDKIADVLLREGEGWRTAGAPPEPAVTIDEQAPAPEVVPTLPTPSALKPEWVAWAIVQGSSPQDAEALTKAQLVQLYSPAADATGEDDEPTQTDPAAAGGEVPDPNPAAGDADDETKE
jgi:hypothetical protein